MENMINQGPQQLKILQADSKGKERGGGGGTEEERGETLRPRREEFDGCRARSRVEGSLLLPTSIYS